MLLRLLQGLAQPEKENAHVPVLGIVTTAAEDDRREAVSYTHLDVYKRQVYAVRYADQHYRGKDRAALRRQGRAAAGLCGLQAVSYTHLS